MYAFSGEGSLPSTGGPGVSAQTLSPDHVSGHRPSSRGLSLPEAAGVGVTTLVYAARLECAIATLGNPTKDGPSDCVEFWPRHADLRFRGRSDRLSSRAIAVAARTYGLVRRPRSGARAALPGEKEHYRGYGSERAKPARNCESRKGLPAYRQRFCIGL